MSDLFKNVKQKVYHLNGVEASDIVNAEKRLGIRFDEEYRNYLMQYGVVSFGSHELLGLGGDSYLDVVEETLRERTAARFPKNCYLIENLGIDGILILQDTQGSVYELSDAGNRKIAGSFGEYIEQIG